jgi:hypothetical protein
MAAAPTMLRAGIVTLPREERKRTCKRYGFSFGRDDVAPRAHRGGAEYAV